MNADGLPEQHHDPQLQLLQLEPDTQDLLSAKGCTWSRLPPLSSWYSTKQKRIWANQIIWACERIYSGHLKWLEVRGKSHAWNGNICTDSTGRLKLAKQIQFSPLAPINTHWDILHKHKTWLKVLDCIVESDHLSISFWMHYGHHWGTSICIRKLQSPNGFFFTWLMNLREEQDTIRIPTSWQGGPPMTMSTPPLVGYPWLSLHCKSSPPSMLFPFNSSSCLHLAMKSWIFKLWTCSQQVEPELVCWSCKHVEDTACICILILNNTSMRLPGGICFNSSSCMTELKYFALVFHTSKEVRQKSF